MGADDPVPALAVRVGRDWIAVATRHIHAVHSYHRHPPPTPLPDSPPWLLGLIDGANGLIPVIHLSRLADKEEPGGEMDRRARLLVCRGRPGLGLRVDEARGILRLRPGTEPAGAAPPALAPYLDGGYGQDEHPWWLLDPERLARHPGLT